MGDYDEVTADEDVDQDVLIAELEQRKWGTKCKVVDIRDRMRRRETPELALAA